MRWEPWGEDTIALRAAQRRSPAGRASRRAFSLIEMLVALTVALVFVSAMYMAFIQVLRATSERSARNEALRNARSALMTMMEEIKAFQRTGTTDTLLVGVNFDLAFGNGLDEDGDGTVDEEILDGQDDATDADWVIANDNHIPFFLTGATPFIYERPQLTDTPDFGDFHVDEDVRFGSDTLSIMLFPPAVESGVTSRTITYSLETFDGEPNVLVKTAKTEFLSSATSTTMAPLAFAVTGLDFLYSDPGASLPPNWTTDWDSATSGVPDAVYVRITVKADTGPIQNYSGGDKIETLEMETIVMIE